MSEHEDHHEQVLSRTYLGFWMYLMSDCILFGCLFAVYAVLHTATAGGPTSQELFHLPSVLIDSFILLVSSFTCGLTMLAANRNEKNKALAWLAITLLLGVAFMAMESIEFSKLISAGNDWQRSAFLSSFFTLIGTHCLHIIFGLLWAVFLIVQIFFRGLDPDTLRRLTCFKLFWMFLNVVWIFVFTFVYLMGAL